MAREIKEILLSMTYPIGISLLLLIVPPPRPCSGSTSFIKTDATNRLVVRIPQSKQSHKEGGWGRP